MLWRAHYCECMTAELFQTSKQNIGQHLKNIFEEGELEQNSVVRNFLQLPQMANQTAYIALESRSSVMKPQLRYQNSVFCWTVDDPVVVIYSA